MIKCFTRSWQCLLDCNASILKQYFKNVIVCLLSTWQYDTYLHLYIYNKSFSRYIKKKKKTTSEPYCTYYWMALKCWNFTSHNDEEFVPWLSQNCFFRDAKNWRWRTNSRLCSCTSSLVLNSRQLNKLLSVFGRTSPIVELVLALLVSCRFFFPISNFFFISQGSVEKRG